MVKRKVLLSIFLCFLLYPICEVKAATDIYVTSDAHIGPSSITTCDAKPWYCVNGGKNNPKMTNAARFTQFLKKINIKGATNRYLLVVGDITQIASDGEYSNYKSLISSSSNNSSSSKVYTAIGNHELRPSLGTSLTEAQYDEKRNRYISYFGNITSNTTLGGIKIVRIGTDFANRPVVPWNEGDGSDTSAAANSSLYGYNTSSTLSYLESQLQAAKSAGQTVIVMTHWPINNTIEDSYATSGAYQEPYRDTSLNPDSSINNIIKKYPNAIVVSGHSHWHFNGLWKFEETSHSMYLHDGTGIKGTPNDSSTEFLKISFSDKKSATIYPQELNWAGTSITTLSKSASPSRIEQFKWSWATVDYDANGGTGTVPNSMYKYQTAGSANLTKTGYELQGWNTKSDGTGESFNPGEEVTVGDVTLYANWDPHKLYARYHANGGTLKSAHGDTVTLEDDVILINGDAKSEAGYYGQTLKSNGFANYNNSNFINLEKEGYTAKKDEEWTDGTKIYSQKTQYDVSEFADLTESDKTVDLYVNWIPEDYEILYDLDGGVGDNPSSYNIETETFTLTEPTREGYKFIGWTGANGDVLQKTVTIEKGSTGNKTYIAHWEPNIYTITFESNGGSEVNPMEVAYNSQIIEPTNPTREGYTFKGWYSDSELSELYVFEYMPAINIKLYAKWEKSTYQIVFDSNGGSSVENQVIEYQNKATKPSDPVRNGYTFKGWYSDSELQTEYNFNSEVTKSMIIYAKWETIEYDITYNLDEGEAENPAKYTVETSTFTLANPVKEGYSFKGWTGSNGLTPQNKITIEQGSIGNKNYIANYNINSYTVTFNSNGGSNVPNQEVNYKAKVIEPVTPEKEDYAFDGWYSDIDLTNEYDFNTAMPARNLTLYAKWTESTFKITYDLDGGLATNPTKYDEETETFTLNNPTKEGHTFIGWTGSNGNNPEITIVIPKGSSGNKNYIANYEINKYTIDYDYEGIPQSKTDYGSDLALPLPVKEGYRFLGWYTNSELTEPFTSETMPAKNLTLYPKFEINTYTINFVTNGGSNISNILKNYNETIGNIPVPTKEGYSFLDWYTNEELTEEFNLTNMPAHDITLYAKWKINTYTVSFNSNGGSAVPSVEVEYNNVISKPSNPTKEGYTLEGWYIDNNLTTKYNFDSKVKQNLTLYAKWIIENYTIVYDLDGGIADNPSLYDITTETFRLNDAIKEGYTFIGWTGSNGSNPEKNISIAKGTTGNKRYNANYRVNSYTISFESNGGSIVEPIEGDYNSTVVEPSEPTKKDYVFAGWYSNQELTKLYSFTTMPAKDLTLYAKWEKDVFVINYSLDGGTNDESNPTTYKRGTTLTIKPATKEGYTFKGWYKDNKFTEKADTITSNMAEDLTLYAKWNKTTYYIEFETNEGDEKQSLPVEYEQPISSISAPTREGYTFKGWYNDPELTSIFSETTMPASNLTLYAKWDINQYKITLDSNGGSTVEPIEGDYNSAITEPTEPLKEGYKFAGWYTDQKLTKLYSFTTIPAKNLTLYAKWVNNSNNVINYVLNGGENNTNNPTNYKSGDEKELFNPTKRGNTFKGWYLDGDFQTRVNKISKDMNGDITLYAKWEANNVIEVPNTGIKTNIVITLLGVSLCAVAGYGIYSKYKNIKLKKTK